MDKAAKGAAALSSKEYSEAVKQYSLAISENPQAVDYYIKRSTAYTRISPPDHDAAFQDAELALALAFKRAKRELIAQAQLRRGIALFGLEAWGNAKRCFEWVKKLDEKEKSITIWQVKVDAKLKALEEGDEKGQETIAEKPDVKLPEQHAEKRVVQKEKNADTDSTTHASTAAAAAPQTPAVQPESVQTPASKIRHEFFDRSDSIGISLFAKGIPKDKAVVEIKANSLEMSFPLATGSDYHFSLDPLFGTIDPAASSYKVMSTKVEFTLKKVSPGKWSALEGTGPVTLDESATNGGSETIKRAVLADKQENIGPAYPTSSKSGPKNWDKLATDLTKKPKQKKEGEESGEEDTGGMDDDEGGDPANTFFKHLYKGASDDTKRAMMKSYQESNGTALSTNWAEVSKGKVETTPPDGMEARKYEY